MIEELKLARLDGRSYEDIQPDVIKLVDYYVGIWYGNFPILKQYNYDSERIVTDVYHGIYLKTKDDGLSNLERHFIKASKIENCTMSYISNLIKNSVLNMLRCRARDVVRKPMLYDYPIPIPPLSEQQRIVSILDRFEALTTDLQSGLPAEIEARRQQYEYYRNKLLTFEAV